MDYFSMEDQKPKSESRNAGESTLISGNILIFYAYDIGDSIDINKLKARKTLKASDMESFPHFKNYHVPLSVNIDEYSEKSDDAKISVKIHSFGVVSLNYIIPFCETIDNLKLKLIHQVEEYKQISRKDARFIFNQIKPVITEPSFFNLKTGYYAVHADNKALEISNKDLVRRYGPQIASLLRLETQNMSEYQIEEVLQASTAYYGSDLLVINSEGAFIFDSEYHEPLELFELAGIQRLELQSFDKLLDKKLNIFYNSDTFKIPVRSYVPLLGSHIDSMLIDIAKLRVDISVITERLKNSVNMSGDSYFQRLYLMLGDAFKLKDWKASIDEKLSIVNEMYSVRKNRLDTVREELQNILIILLIAVEVALAVIKK